MTEPLTRSVCARCEPLARSLHLVIAGLDPAIHAATSVFAESVWTTGSSPVVTKEDLRVRAPRSQSGRSHIARRRKRHCAHSAIKISTMAVAIQNLE
jgi:hypothetical protein